MIAKKVGKMNIKNGFGLYSNPSCLIFWICVWVYGVMDTLPPHLLISSKSDFSIFRKSMINSKEFLLLSWDLEAMFSLIHGPSISWLMCGPPFYILLQLLCSLFVHIFLLSWAHAIPTLLYALIETLTLHCCYCFLEWSYESPIIQI